MLTSARTSGTADTLIEIGRFLLEARAASRRAARGDRPAAFVRDDRGAADRGAAPCLFPPNPSRSSAS